MRLDIMYDSIVSILCYYAMLRLRQRQQLAPPLRLPPCGGTAGEDASEIELCDSLDQSR